MKQYLIRRVMNEDLNLLQHISRQTFRESFQDQNDPADMDLYIATRMSEEKLLEEMKESGSMFYFILSEDEVAGYLKVNTGSAQTEHGLPMAMEIERIYLLSSHQGTGAGQLLLDHARTLAVSAGLKILWLGVWEKNLRAIKFYERNGFVVFDQHSFLLGTDLQTDLLMKLDL